MSDFLGNLTIRSTGAKHASAGASSEQNRPVIRPRVASIFEPLLPLGNRQPDANLADEETHERSSTVEESLDTNRFVSRDYQPILPPKLPAQQNSEERQSFSPDKHSDGENMSAEDLRLLLDWTNRHRSAPRISEPGSESDRHTNDRKTVSDSAASFVQSVPRVAVAPIVQEAKQPLTVKSQTTRDEESISQPSERVTPFQISVPAVQIRTEQVIERIVTERVPKPHDVTEIRTNSSSTAQSATPTVESNVHRVVPITTREKSEATIATRSRGESRRVESQPVIAHPRTTVAIKPPESTEPTEAAPVIQVTIGRIEVRANAPTSQPQPRRATQSTMSLDDYLKKHKRGGGR